MFYFFLLLVPAWVSAVLLPISPRQQGISSCPTTPTTAVINNAVWSICPNTDYSVGTTTDIPVGSASACAAACATVSTCKKAVYNKVGKICHLKGDPQSKAWNINTAYDTVEQVYNPTGETLTSCPISTIPYKSDSGSTWTICPLTGYAGDTTNAIYGINNNTACAEACAHSGGCKQAAYDRANSVCYLKSNAVTWLGDGRYDAIYMAAPGASANSSKTSGTLSSPTITSKTSMQTSSTTTQSSTSPTGLAACPGTVQNLVARGVGYALCPKTNGGGSTISTTNNVADAAACAAIAGTSQGTTVVYDHENRICLFKGSPKSLSYVPNEQFDVIQSVYTSKPDAPLTSCPWGNTTYTSTPPGSFNVCPLAVFTGPSIQIQPNVASLTLCADLCASLTGCNKATYDQVNRVCHIKGNGADIGWQTNNDFVTITRASTTTNGTNQSGIRIGTAAGNTAVVLGSCGVSAQHMFLGTDDKLMIVDKSQSNPLLLPNGVSASNAAFSLSTGSCQALGTKTNQFCAGGGALGDGRWVSGGGNPQENVQGQTSGLQAVRQWTPCNDGTCDWTEGSSFLQVARWYPTAEPTADGSLIYFGGYDRPVYLPQDTNGHQPNAEYIPSKGPVIPVPVLLRAYPFSLYPFINLLSDSRILIVANKEAAIWNPSTQVETRLPSVPNGPRTYPAGGMHVMFPLVPSNGYTETMMYCGGAGLTNWGPDPFCPPGGSFAIPGSQKCDIISPLKDAKWRAGADLPSRRVMGNMLLLPDNKILAVNGAKNGLQAFGCDGPDGSLGTDPANVVHLYDPATNSWSIQASQAVTRVYHSSAVLVPDGSVVMGGSAPHYDVTEGGEYPTEYRIEAYYPSYYDKPRPSGSSVPTKFAYGGASFALNFNSTADASNAYIRLIRSGWSTHGLQMGQRSIELQRTVSGTTVTYSGLPNNRNLFAPGPTLAFLVVNGIPSMGKVALVG